MWQAAPAALDSSIARSPTRAAPAVGPATAGSHETDLGRSGRLGCFPPAKSLSLTLGFRTRGDVSGSRFEQALQARQDCWPTGEALGI